MSSPASSSWQASYTLATTWQTTYRGVRDSHIYPYVLLGIALLIALGFEFVNGFHDTANAVATVIYTNSMSPNLAVVWSGFFNFLGAADMFGLPASTTHVLSSGVAGTMVANRSGLQWATVRNLLMAWVLTLPVSIALAGALFWLLRALL